MEKYSAVMLFRRFYNISASREECETDYLEVIDNIGVSGSFYFLKMESNQRNHDDVILFKIMSPDVPLNSLIYNYASAASNFSYSFNRKVELHLFSDKEFEQLKSANGENYSAIRKEIVAPTGHLVFEKGELLYYGELYDVLSYL